jgi:hypothetical protein
MFVLLLLLLLFNEALVHVFNNYNSNCTHDAGLNLNLNLHSNLNLNLSEFEFECCAQIRFVHTLFFRA